MGLRPLNDLERRIVAHLPVWVEDEAAHVAAETEVHGASVRSYSLDEFTARMAGDPFSPELTREQVALALQACVHEGWAWRDGSGEEPRYGMTKVGFESLHLRPEQTEQTVGSAVIDLAPGRAQSEAALA